MKKITSLLFAILSLVNYLQAQNVFPANGSVGIGTVAPNASAILAVNSTTQGVVFPRMKQAQRDAIAAPATSLLIYQKDGTPGFYYYDGAAWKPVTPAPVVGANLTLSNLSSTAVNTSLTPGVSNSIDLGTSSIGWRNAYLLGSASIGTGTLLGKFTVQSGTSYGADLGTTRLFGNNGSNNNALTAEGNVGGISGSTTLFSRAYLAGYQAIANGVTVNYGVWGHQFGTGAGGYGGVFSVGASMTASTNYVLLAGTSGQGGYFGGGNVQIKHNDPAADYTGSQVIMEIGPGSAKIPSISFLNNFDPTPSGIKLYGSGGVGLLVLDETGVSYRPITASAFNVSSDRTVKKDITDVKNTDYANYLDQIRKIESVTYRYNNEVATASASNPNAVLREYPHVGFIAQTLPDAIQAKIPTSGNVKPDFKLGYNLSDMAGLTLIGIKALDAELTAKNDIINNQQKQIDQLQQQMKLLMDKFSDLQKAQDQCCANASARQATDNISIITDRGSLEQNVPNPFNSNTSINYTLPQKYTSAKIIVNDNYGKSIKQISVSGTGKGSVSLNAGSLPAGSYKYSLLVDGKIISSKTMVITR